MRKKGLRIFHKDSAGVLQLVSYQSPRSTTWHWILSIERDHFPKSRWLISRDQRRTGQWHDHIRLPLICVFTLSRQDYHEKWNNNDMSEE